MSKQLLENIIKNFDLDNFRVFFSKKNYSFKPSSEKVKSYDEENFQDGELLGKLEFDLIDKLLVFAFKVKKNLSERSSKKAQYELGRKILMRRNKEHADFGIFIFYDSNGNFRFSLIYKTPVGTKEEWSNFRRFTYFVSQDSANVTFLKQIGEADFSSLEKIKEAFSVEKVTEEFYKELSNWYFWALKEISFPKDVKDDKDKKIFVIRMITRLIFVWFMKQKGLIGEKFFKEDEIKKKLKEFTDNGDSYYKAILQNLFFATLNTPEEKRGFRDKNNFQGKNKDFMRHDIYRYEKYFQKPEEILEFFEDIPFLNGGLFECLDEIIEEEGKNKYIRIDGFSDRSDNLLKVPNYLFFSSEREVKLNREYNTRNKKYKVEGLINLFNRYNFTIDESTPQDVDIALDPELLGHVFENLLAYFNPETSFSARKSTGSYYTPRQIVDYMVDESLKAYFKTKIKIKDIDKKLDKLFSYSYEDHDFTNQEVKDLIRIINNIKIIDPAVGSGAFPMGILQRLVFILSKIDPNNELWKQEQIEAVEKNVSDISLRKKLIKKIEDDFKNNGLDYGRKLYLIQNCIYGVDIQSIAIQISKLRFFISLLVDMKGDKVEPLPNLETKFVTANFLIELDSSSDKELITTQKMKDLRLDSDIDELFKNRKKYFTAVTKKEKDNIKNKDKEIRERILSKVKEYLRKKEQTIKFLEEEKRKIKSQEFGNISVQSLNIPNFSIENRNVDLKQMKIAEIEKEISKNKKQKKKIEKILDKYNKVAEWDFYKTNKVADWFNSEWMFGTADGFDIVIGNPPYGVKVKNDIKERNGLGSKDSYGVFISTSLKRFLKHNGVLSFIVSDTWLTIKTHKPLREQVLEKQLHKIIRLHQDCFNATVNACIMSVTNSQNNNGNIIAADLTNISTRKEVEELRKKLYRLEKFIGQSTPKFAVYKYRQNLIKTNSNLPIFVGSPKLFALMNDTTCPLIEKEINGKKVKVREIKFNGKIVELVRFGDIAEVKVGLQTGDNKYYLFQNPEARGSYRNINEYKQYLLTEKDLEKIRNNEELRLKVIEKGFHKSRNEKNFDEDLWFGGRYIVPHDKGGESDTKSGWLPNYYVPTNYFIDWSQEAVKRMKILTIRQRDGKGKDRVCSRFQNKEYYFKEGITFSMRGIYSPSFRGSNYGIFDVMSSQIFIGFSLDFCLSILCSKLNKFIIKNFIEHTVATDVDALKENPFSISQNKKIIQLVKQIIEKQKQNPRYDYMSNEQKEIDRLVYEIYGLDKDDIREVEIWYARRYPKLARFCEV